MDDDQEKAACVSSHVEAEGASGGSKGVRVQVAVIQRLRGPGQREGQGSKLGGVALPFRFWCLQSTAVQYFRARLCPPDNDDSLRVEC